MRYAMQRPRRLTLVLVGLVGFAVGVTYRGYVDEQATRELANYLRSGLHGAGIALSAWLVQVGFTSNAQSPLGLALKRLPRLAELFVRSLATTVVIIVVGILLQVVLYAEPYRLHWATRSWFTETLPAIVGIGLVSTLVVGAIIEALRLIGGPMLLSIALGTYYRPVRERLIVMFLDIADSTRLAEQMGELKVHDLITRFFFDIDRPIADHGGVVRSYVGDEVIVTWPVTSDAARNARCLACFVAIERQMAQLATDYADAFAVVPRFRAGIHAGPVVVSECGSARRQLAFFGDTMNVVARLCEYCKTVDRRLVVSDDLLGLVRPPADLRVGVGQRISLRGREQPIVIHVIETEKAAAA